MRAMRSRKGAPQIHAEAPGNVILEGKVKTAGFDEVWNGAHKIVAVDVRSHRQNAHADGGARGARRL